MENQVTQLLKAMVKPDYTACSYAFMQDGKIDAREALQLEQILCALDHIMQDIRKLKQTFSTAYTTNTTGVSGSES